MTVEDWLSSQAVGLENMWALLFAAAGLVLGAWLTKRSELKRYVLQEITAVRAAHALCGSFVNRLLALKERTILPLHRDFYVQKEELLAAAREGGNKTIQARMDLQVVEPFGLSVRSLERLVLDGMSCPNTGLVAAAEFVASIEALTKSTLYRNELVADFLRRTADLGEADRACLFFGLPRGGQVDARIDANVGSLYRQLDEALFFGQQLEHELAAYHQRIRRRFVWRYRLSAPSLERSDRRAAEQKGLLPTRARYTRWTTVFERRPSIVRRVFRRSGSAAG